MPSKKGLIARLLRMIVAFSAFVAALCALVYLGFEVKFQPSDFYKKNRNLPQSSEGHQLFYRTVGRTPDGMDVRQLSRPDNLGQRFTLEIAIVGNRDEAEAFVDKLIDKGVQAYYTPLQTRSGLIFRIRRGVYESSQRAKFAAGELKSKKNIAAKVVRLR